jgi:hypothetical protein
MKDAILREMRMELEAQGIHEQDGHELLSTLDWHAALELDDVEGGSSRKEGEP